MMKPAILALLSLVTLSHPADRPGPAIQAQSHATPPFTGAMHNFTLETPPVPAPEVSFQDPSGHDTGFDALRGHVVLVNIWATWCGPCVEELPTLARLRVERQHSDFKLVELSEDRGGAAIVQRFFARHDFGGLDSYLDPHGHVGDALNIHAFPTTLLLDRDGNILGRLVGATSWDGPEAKALIDWALNKRTLPAAEPIAMRLQSSRDPGSSGLSSVSTR